MLIRRGARVNVTNMGDDTPLHLAAAHGHRPIVQLVSLCDGSCGISNVSSSSIATIQNTYILIHIPIINTKLILLLYLFITFLHSSG